MVTRAPRKSAKPAAKTLAKTPSTNFLFTSSEAVSIKVPKPHPRNPRIGDVDAVAESLKEHGQFKPIVMNRRNGFIAAGHHTWMAARKLGWEEIQVVWIDVDEKQHQKIMLIDNKTSDAGTYDEAVLAEILAGMSDDLVGTGYSPADLQDLIDSVSKLNNEGGGVSAEDLRGLMDEMPDMELRSKSKRQQYEDDKEDDEDYREAQIARGAPVKPKKDEQDDAEEIDDIVEAEAELQAVLEVKVENFDFWKQGDDYGIPPLREDLLMQEIPPNLETWGGHDVTPDDGEKWFLYNFSLGGIKGLPFDRSILCFYCADEATEAMTKRGWLKWNEITEDDTILSMDPVTKELKWSVVKSIFRKKYSGKMHHLSNTSIDALVTPNHKFALTDGSLVPVEALTVGKSIQTMGTAVQGGTNVYTDAFVELVGWAVTEGCYHPCAVTITQKRGSEGEQYIRDALKFTKAEFSEHTSGVDCAAFRIMGDVAQQILAVSPGRVLSMEFVRTISTYQRSLLIEVMLDGDGWRSGKNARQYFQKDRAHIDVFVALCSMAGVPTTTKYREWKTVLPNRTEHLSAGYTVTLRNRMSTKVGNIDFHGGRRDKRGGKPGSPRINPNVPMVDYDGYVWCPETEYGTWVCRRNGRVYVTGNTYDEKFEGWWETPAWYTARILAKGCRNAVVPDFSFYYSQPRVVHLHNVYRAQWVGRFFQEAGMRVAPRLQFDYSDPKSLEIALRGIPKGCPVLATSQQNPEDKTDEKKIAEHLQHALDTIQPKSLIYYSGNPGRRAMEQVKYDGEVKYLMNFVGVRREIAFGKQAGLGAKTAKQRKVALDKARKKLTKSDKPEATEENEE